MSSPASGRSAGSGPRLICPLGPTCSVGREACAAACRGCRAPGAGRGPPPLATSSARMLSRALRARCSSAGSGRALIAPQAGAEGQPAAGGCRVQQQVGAVVAVPGVDERLHEQQRHRSRLDLLVGHPRRRSHDQQPTIRDRLDSLTGLVVTSKIVLLVTSEVGCRTAGDPADRRRKSMVILLGLAAAVLYGSGDFLGGMATRRTHVLPVLMLADTAGVVVALAAAAMSPSAVSLAGLAWGISAGLIGGLGLIIFYIGLATGPMSVVAPVSGLVSTILPVAIALADGERPDSRRLRWARSSAWSRSCWPARPATPAPSPPARPGRTGPGHRLRHRFRRGIRPVLPPHPQRRTVRGALARGGRADRRAGDRPDRRGRAAARPATARNGRPAAAGGGRCGRDRCCREHLLRGGHQDRYVRPGRRAGLALPRRSPYCWPGWCSASACAGYSGSGLVLAGIGILLVAA